MSELGLVLNLTGSGQRLHCALQVATCYNSSYAEKFGGPYRAADAAIKFLNQQIRKRKVGKTKSTKT